PLGARLDVEAATVTSRPRVGLDDVGARAVLDRPADVARQSLADRDTPTGVVGHGLHLDDGTLEALLGVDGDACRRRLSLASQRRAQRHTGTAEREDSQGRHNQGAEELGHFISPYGLVSGQQKEPHTPTAWPNQSAGLHKPLLNSIF